MDVAIAENPPVFAPTRLNVAERVPSNQEGVYQMSNLIHNDNYGYRSDDQESLNSLTNMTGPAVDDEMAANCASHFLEGHEEQESEPTHAKVNPRAIDPTPVFDLESFEAMYASLGLAIDEPTYTHDWQ